MTFIAMSKLGLIAYDQMHGLGSIAELVSVSWLKET